MDTIKEINKLIKEAKEGKNKFPSLDKSEKFYNDLKDYAGKKNPDSVASKYGYVLGHSEITTMLLLDEINRLQREIDLLQ